MCFNEYRICALLSGSQAQCWPQLDVKIAISVVVHYVLLPYRLGKKHFFVNSELFTRPGPWARPSHGIDVCVCLCACLFVPPPWFQSHPWFKSHPWFQSNPWLKSHPWFRSHLHFFILPFLFLHYCKLYFFYLIFCISVICISVNL